MSWFMCCDILGSTLLFCSLVMFTLGYVYMSCSLWCSIQTLIPPLRSWILLMTWTNIFFSFLDSLFFWSKHVKRAACQLRVWHAWFKVLHMNPFCNIGNLHMEYYTAVKKERALELPFYKHLQLGTSPDSPQAAPPAILTPALGHSHTKNGFCLVSVF